MVILGDIDYLVWNKENSKILLDLLFMIFLFILY